MRAAPVVVDFEVDEPALAAATPPESAALLFDGPPRAEGDGGTVFELRTLTQREYLRVMQHVSDRDGSLALDDQGLILALRFGLRGWRQLPADDGRPLAVTPDNVDRIAAPVLSALASEIINRSRLTPAEKKA